MTVAESPDALRRELGRARPPQVEVPDTGIPPSSKAPGESATQGLGEACGSGGPAAPACGTDSDRSGGLYRIPGALHPGDLPRSGTYQPGDLGASGRGGSR